MNSKGFSSTLRGEKKMAKNGSHKLEDHAGFAAAHSLFERLIADDRTVKDRIAGLRQQLNGATETTVPSGTLRRVKELLGDQEKVQALEQLDRTRTELDAALNEEKALAIALEEQQRAVAQARVEAVRDIKQARRPAYFAKARQLIEKLIEVAVIANELQDMRDELSVMAGAAEVTFEFVGLGGVDLSLKDRESLLGFAVRDALEHRFLDGNEPCLKFLPWHNGHH
jgi:hypothetical protein